MKGNKKVNGLKTLVGREMKKKKNPTQLLLLYLVASLNRCDLGGLSCILPVYGVTNTSASERDFGSKRAGQARQLRVRKRERESRGELLILNYSYAFVASYFQHPSPERAGSLCPLRNPFVLGAPSFFWRCYLHLFWGRLDRESHAHL